MPTYEYRCAKCGEDLEVYQTFTEEPLKKHAGCGGKLMKVLSSVGIVLKGSGFYKTDNRDSSTKREARADASGGGDSGGGDSAATNGSGSEKSGKSEASEKSGAKSSDSGSSSGDSAKAPSSNEKKNGEKKSGEKKSPVKSA